MKKSNILSVIFVFLLTLTLVACTGGNKKKLTRLPDLTGKNKTQITEILNNGKVDFEFENVFVKGSTVIEFVSFGNGLQAGDTIDSDSKIIVNMSVDYLVLPDLAGLNREEIKSKLEELGVPSKDISFKPGNDKNVPVGTFITYDGGVKIGDEYTFQKRLIIIYDMSTALPDLNGKNKSEIVEFLRELSLTNVKFEYVLDDSKEYDSFAGYVDFKVGDSVTGNDEIIIKLYSNSNVNIGESISVEKQLFISKYIDSNGENQAIELFNPTNKDLDLADYYLAILSNGQYLPSETVTMTGTIKANETFLIVKQGADDENLLEHAGLVTNKLIFDGNDTIQLRFSKNNTYIDTIYDIGNISATLDDEVFVRRAYITAGNRKFVQNDWMGYIPTYTSIVGTHPVVVEENPSFELIADKTFQEFGMTEVEFLSAADGDTVYFKSLDPRDTSSYNGDKRIRFIMVDTPETEKPNVKGEPYAQVAKSFTMLAMTKSSKIYIQSDQSSGLTETYGRHLGYIWYHLDNDESFIGINGDGSATVLKAGWHLLNFELVKYGLGERILAKTDKYKQSITPGNRYSYQWAQDAEFYAKTNKQGMYSGVNRD